MSWSFFNKRKPTAKLSVVDREFERDVAKCSQLETNTKKLYKDMKRYNESLAELSKLESKIAQDISTLPLERGNHLEELSTTLKNLERYRLDLTTNVAKTTIVPMKKFSGVFPNVNYGLKKREQYLQEYTRLNEKVEKYRERLEREKTPQNSSKHGHYSKELESAKIDYDQHSAIMSEELPRLLEGRITYFEPCFEALQKSQVDYYSKCCQAYGDLVESIRDDTHLVNMVMDDDMQPQNDVQEMLAEFRTLSIVGNVQNT